MAGELDRAQALAPGAHRLRQLQQPGRAIGEVLVADVLIARGELDDGGDAVRGAAAALAPTGYSWGPLAWMLLAQALGQQGATVEAGKALSRAESRHGLKSMLFAPELALARAWTMLRAATGTARSPRRARRRAPPSAEGNRQSRCGAFHDAVRLGDIRAADGIARLGVDCVFGRLALEHGRALVAGDGAALDDLSARFDAIGMQRAAAGAAGQATRQP